MTMFGLWDGPPKVEVKVTVGVAPEHERVDVSATPRTGYVGNIWPPNNKAAIERLFGPSQRVTAPIAASPPRIAEFLLYCFLSKEERAALIGDVWEEYQTELLPKFGPRGAKVWYWSQVIRSIVPVVFNFLSKLRKLGH